jgi:two-component system, repressor protein LuxO
LQFAKIQFMLPSMATTPIASLFSGLRVLVVEDVIALAIQYRTLAAKLQVHTTTAGTVAEALRQVHNGPWHAALVDLNLPDGSGFEVMQTLLRVHPGCSVVVITAEDSLDNAVRASEAGAFDYIEKPVESERLLVTLRNALHASQLSQRVASLEAEAPQQFEQFIGQSAEMQTVYRMLDTVAASNAPVCITGESGTGKELAALAIHGRSPRKNKKLVTINCAAIPKELIESELFGHAKGAFTGAVTERLGAFMEADKGTLFLDEIAELDVSVQAKLLRVLQTGEVKRLGEDKTRIVDVRVVCATHRNLSERVRTGAFREDLFYRLYVVPIELPPLRQRGDDVLLIARELLIRYAREDGKQLRDFSPEVLAALRLHAWPGNVRELVNVVRAVVALHDGPTVEVAMLPASLRNSVPSASTGPSTATPTDEVPWFAQSAGATAPAALDYQGVGQTASPAPTGAKGVYDAGKVRPLDALEREAVDYALRAFGGNVAQAAKALQVNPSTLYRKIQVWTAQGSLQAGQPV